MDISCKANSTPNPQNHRGVFLVKHEIIFKQQYADHEKPLTWNDMKTTRNLCGILENERREWEYSYEWQGLGKCRNQNEKRIVLWKMLEWKKETAMS